MTDRPDSRPPAWIEAALAEPVAGRDGGPDALMARIRALPAPARFAPPPMHTRWRRGVLGPAAGALATAGCAAVLLLGRALPSLGGAGAVATAEVLKDTVVAQVVGLDTIGHDTLRLVRFALEAPAAARVALVATLVDGRRVLARAAREGADRWAARAVVPRDVLHYAFLVDDTRLVPVPRRF